MGKDKNIPDWLVPATPETMGISHAEYQDRMSEALQSTLDPYYISERLKELIGKKVGLINDDFESVENVLLLYNSYARFGGFLSISARLNIEQFCRGFALAYNSGDNLFRHKEDITSCLLKVAPYPEYLMSKREITHFNKLPETLILYRGMSKTEYESRLFGYSWTTDKKIARWFSEKYRRNNDTSENERVVAQATVNKSDCIFYSSARKEKEIVIHPHAVI